MNCVLHDMLRCLNNEGNNIITANGEMGIFSFPIQAHDFDGNISSDQDLSELVSGRVTKPDPDVDTGWVLGHGNGSDFETGRLCSANGSDGFKKRKADTFANFNVDEEQYQNEKMKETAEESSDKNGISESTKCEPSIMNSKAKKMALESPNTDYIHVRARPGQATDSHSLAERVRREKISERMKYLQDLVPDGDKIIGKAGLLDEIINYVQSLQRQVEFLSMKLAAINPRLDLDVEKLQHKEMMIPICTQSNVEFNSLARGVSFHGLETGVNPSSDARLDRTITATGSLLEEPQLDSSCLNQIQHSNWDYELQNFHGLSYQQQFAGCIRLEK